MKMEKISKKQAEALKQCISTQEGRLRKQIAGLKIMLELVKAAREDIEQLKDGDDWSAIEKIFDRHFFVTKNLSAGGAKVLDTILDEAWRIREKWNA